MLEYKGKKHFYKVGEKYNLKKVVSLFYKGTRLYANTICTKCGKSATIRATDLYNAKTNSCICQLKRKSTNYNKRLYSIYLSMKYRCYSINCHAYKNYGEEVFRDRGYYVTLEGVLNGYLKAQTREFVQNNEANIKELIKEIKKQTEFVKKLNLKV